MGTKKSKRRQRLRSLAKAAFVEGFMVSGEAFNGERLEDQGLSDSQVAIELESEFDDWYKTDKD